MRVKRVRLILLSLSGALALCSITVLAWTMSNPPELSISAAGNHIVPSPVSPTTQAAFDSAELRQVMQVDLRRSLRDPPPLPPPALPVARPFPPLDIKLAGTIVEPGHSQAMIQLSDGSVQFKSIGDSAGDAVIQQIEEGSVTVEFHGQIVNLTVPKEKGADEH